MGTRKKAAMTAALLMFLTACSSGESESAETQRTVPPTPITPIVTQTPKPPEPEPSEIVTEEPAPTRTPIPADIYREAAQSMALECQAQYVNEVEEMGLIEDSSIKEFDGGRFEEERGMIDIFGEMHVDGVDESLPWVCTISQNHETGDWQIVFITHGEDSPFRSR